MSLFAHVCVLNNAAASWRSLAFHGQRPPPDSFVQAIYIQRAFRIYSQLPVSFARCLRRLYGLRVIKIWTQKGTDFVCGICGAIGLDSKVNSEAVVRRMLSAIVHRGPDEEGILVAPPVVAGARRLSIIDLPGGSQPIWNETGTLAVVYNGEIYNFRELHKELEAAGHTFRTNSDTEVIVHAFETWGEKCVERLQGMFTFALGEMPQGP